MLKDGEGPFPENGDFVVINYIGFLNNGTVFDNTEVRGKKALSFTYGKNQIIPGLESVIGNLQAGAEATCTVPAKYAFGSKGVCTVDGCLVPPNETLKYVIKVKRVAPGYT